MGGIRDRMPVSSSPSSSSVTSLPLLTMPVDLEMLRIAEGRTQEILSTIQPVYVSDRSRNGIINYLKALIKDRLGLQVFLFGSVPLKTYLPDGDIDMSVLTPKDKEEEYAKRLCNLLKNVAGRSGFRVTNVQYITAQVKVIKCQIRNIAVDISFNQMAGICALCFLEQVDLLFGREHLYKRSIILVKAWCFYESRVLGSNTGLISTYALAVLVLHIINMSNVSLSGPLAVLLKFLDYYSSFDWDNYAITVNGPVPISSLPDVETGTPELFISKAFFKACVELYSVPTKAVAEANGHYFPVKHFNIVDPLKHTNNLGRSVTPGNLRRIKHAFGFGARRLKDALTFPGEFMGWKLERFFSDTVERNGKGQRQDVVVPVIPFGTGRYQLSDLTGDIQGYFNCMVYGKWFYGKNQHHWIPQGDQEKSTWDAASWFVACQKNAFYYKNLMNLTLVEQPVSNNVPNSRGTGTYIPEMSQESYSHRFSSEPSTVNSLPSGSEAQASEENP